MRLGRLLGFVFVIVASAAALSGVVNAGDDVVGASVTPIQIRGCWMGNVTNDSFGNTTVEFLLDQRGDKIKIVKRPCPVASNCGGSSILFGVFGGPIGGRANSTGFTFHGRVKAIGNPATFPVGNHGCGIVGQGVLQQDGSIEGSYSFRGRCAGNGGDFKVFAACN